jgi:replicative DNA helicase
LTDLANRSVEIGRALLLEIIARPELLFVAKKHITESDFIKGTDRDVWNRILYLEKNGKEYTEYNIVNPNDAGSIDANKLKAWVPDTMLYECKIQFFEERVIDFINLVDREKAAYYLARMKDKIEKAEYQTGQEVAGALNDLCVAIYKMHPTLSTGYAGEHIYNDIQELKDNAKSGMKFGIPSIDARMNGLIKKQYVLLAARPGVGKSSLFLYPLAEYCMAGKHVTLLTLEMVRSEMSIRMIANRANVMMDKIIGKVGMNTAEEESVKKAIQEIKEWKLSIIDQGMNTPAQIDHYLTSQAAEKKPVELFIIDHFGLLQPNTKPTASRYNDYTAISNELKSIAKKHNCVILSITQLNRIEDKTKPTKESLRDSGSLEQDADKIIAMWKGDTGTRDIHVALIKNRQGEEFETTLEFYASSMQFYDQGKSAQETQNYLGDTDGILPFDL